MESFKVRLMWGFSPQPRGDANHKRLKATYKYTIISRGTWFRRSHLHYLHFRWKLLKASMEASIASMEVWRIQCKQWKLSWKIPRFQAVKASMKASVEASVVVTSMEV